MNKSSIRKLAGLLVLAVLLAAAPLAPAEEAPNVTELMNSYTELDLSPYLGKTVFINFFTEWCYYCMQEMPDIKALYDTYSCLLYTSNGVDERSIRFSAMKNIAVVRLQPQFS